MGKHEKGSRLRKEAAIRGGFIDVERGLCRQRKWRGYGSPGTSMAFQSKQTRQLLPATNFGTTGLKIIAFSVVQIFSGVHIFFGGADDWSHPRSACSPAPCRLPSVARVSHDVYSVDSNLLA